MYKSGYTSFMVVPSPWAHPNVFLFITHFEVMFMNSGHRFPMCFHKSHTMEFGPTFCAAAVHHSIFGIDDVLPRALSFLINLYNHLNNRLVLLMPRFLTYRYLWQDNFFPPNQVEIFLMPVTFPWKFLFSQSSFSRSFGVRNSNIV